MNVGSNRWYEIILIGATAYAFERDGVLLLFYRGSVKLQIDGSKDTKHSDYHYAVQYVDICSGNGNKSNHRTKNHQ